MVARLALLSLVMATSLAIRSISETDEEPPFLGSWSVKSDDRAYQLHLKAWREPILVNFRQSAFGQTMVKLGDGVREFRMRPSDERIKGRQCWVGDAAFALRSAFLTVSLGRGTAPGLSGPWRMDEPILYFCHGKSQKIHVYQQKKHGRWSAGGGTFERPQPIATLT
eukprot:CAMPEP_0170362074 /NCGR_PEP_ID=MMETSP0117_2-20130122/4140_1 /TAXON_ID=400756 /ORGANISM="Durinskia baltica, Strain CSIRO CS-38" /LENGTH=166 /DNA_ID=CAMNT_0010616471 /DNA_START=106 /DNA_END=606 /DNA_ORIENTATION=-